jgi:hypothetical protein
MTNKWNIDLLKEKMTEKEVRDAIERATRSARLVEAQKGKGDVSHEKLRDTMIRNAERDKREGKI